MGVVSVFVGEGGVCCVDFFGFVVLQLICDFLCLDSLVWIWLFVAIFGLLLWAWCLGLFAGLVVVAFVDVGFTLVVIVLMLCLGLRLFCGCLVACGLRWFWLYLIMLL